MLKPKKKVTKREIKEDKLVTTYFEFRTWMEQNRRLVSYIIGTPIALVIVWLLWRNNVENNNRAATTQLARVVQYYDQGKYEQAINGVPEENVRGLQAIVDDFGSTRAGQIAKLYLANSYFSLRNYSKALEYYLDADLPDKVLAASALAGAGACYEAQGNHEMAASYFEKAASKNMTVFEAPGYIHSAAVNFAQAGRKDRAVELLKRLKKEFPDSPLARDTDRYIAEYGS